MARRNSWASYVIWGSIAVCAVLAAAVTIALVVGNHRGIQFASIGKQSAPPPAAGQPQAEAPQPAPEPVIIAAAPARDHEIARLNDALRLLSAERDRLEERLVKLEQGLGDITASINTRAAQAPPSVQAAPRIAEQAEAPAAKSPARIAAAPSQPIAPEAARHGVPPAGAIEAPGGEMFMRYVTARPVVEPPSATQEPMQIHANPVAREQAAVAPARESTATRTEFAVDLGSEPNMDALRARWTSLSGGHAPTLGNLRPLVSVREGNRPGSVELRLIAGPLANAGDAARACASLQAKGVNCNTAVYDGQRLAPR